MNRLKNLFTVTVVMISSCLTLPVLANMTVDYSPETIRLIEERNMEDIKLRLAGEDVRISVAVDKNIVEGIYYFKVRNPQWSLLEYKLYMPQYVLEGQETYNKPTVIVDGAELEPTLMETPVHYANIPQVPGLKTIWWSYIATRNMIVQKNPITVEVKFEQANFNDNGKKGSIYVPMIPQDTDLTDYPANFTVEVRGTEGVVLTKQDLSKIEGSLKVTPKHFEPIITYVSPAL